MSLDSSGSKEVGEKGSEVSLILNESIEKKEVGKKEVEKGTGLALDLGRFDPKRKVLFIKFARKLYPNISKICSAVHISTQTYYNHLKSDPEFNKSMVEVDQAITDEIEGVLQKEARKPKKFLDRISYLRAHRPELYDRAKVIKVEGYKMSPEDSKRRGSVLDQVIDGEIVQALGEKPKTKIERIGGGEAQRGG
jgi:hypothetical protein